MAMSPYLTTPFHDRIAPLCETDSRQRWEGYTTVATVTALDEEYFAIRNAATLFDTSPLRNYRVAGAHAERFVDRLITRDITRCAVGQVYYSGWCDDAGKLIEDGTIMRLGADEFQINAQEANLRWFEDTAYGLDVTIEEITEDVASLALQGPLSMTLLRDLGLAGIDALALFRIALFELDGARLMVSRTGFTGDLGYELWIAPAHAGMLWDRLMAAGRVQAADRHRLRGARSGAHRGWLHPGQCRVHLGDAYTARQPDALALRTWPRLDGQPREGPLHRQARARCREGARRPAPAPGRARHRGQETSRRILPLCRQNRGRAHHLGDLVAGAQAQYSAGQCRERVCGRGHRT